MTIRASIARGLSHLLSLGPRQGNDESVLQELTAAPPALPPGLELEWLGTAGFRIAYEGTTVLVDPYLTRRTLLRTLSAEPMHPDPELISRHVPRCDAVLVGHTHFDHAVDVPGLAAACGARVYGSSSLKRLMKLHGLPGHAVEVAPGKVHSIGPFEVTFVESTHAKLVLGLRVPFDGELSCDHLDDLRGSAYRCGQVYGIHLRVAGVTLYHLGSADLLDDRIAHRGVDFLLAGIAGRGFARDYALRVLRGLEPRVVIPHHFDDFFRPLDAEMGFSLNVNLGGFVEEVHRVSSDFEVRAMLPFRKWSQEGGGS